MSEWAGKRVVGWTLGSQQGPSQPLSALLLCRVPFWRFLITGADQNRELKMWCTVSWTCLQTIR